MTRSFLKAIVPYLKQIAGLLFVGSLGGVLMNTAVVLPPLLLGRLIDTAMAWAEGNAVSEQVLLAGAAYAGAMALYQTARLAKRLGLRMGNRRIAASLRADALRGVLAWPMARLHRTPIGDLMARIIGDVDVMVRGISEITTETWDTLLFSVSLIVSMLAIDPGLTFLALIPVPLAMVLAQTVGHRVSERTTLARRANARLTAYLQERLTGLAVLRLFGRIQSTVAQVANLSRSVAEANMASIRLRSGLQPVYTALMASGVVLVIWLGGRKVALGAATLGTFVAYLDLYGRFVGRGHRIPQLFNSVQSGAAAFARLEPLLNRPLNASLAWRSTFSLDAVPGADRQASARVSRPAGPCTVSVRGVTFRFPGSTDAALRNLDLEVASGRLVAVTGPVGSGKSALARALLGLYPLEGGQILIDGQSITEMSPTERSARIGYQPQAPFLFSGTVQENILVDRQSSCQGDDRIARSLQLAGLEEDILDLPQGVDTQIGEQGVRLSGGQRQRIALARAAAVLPGLLVLDDPFSSVDVKTEAIIIQRLRDAFGPSAPPERQATIIFFSHRLAAFPVADHVVVLGAGHVIEQGSHTSLLRAGGLYARICRAQHRIEGREADLEFTG